MELVESDAVARYHRLRGDDVYFLTGTDENSLKNVLAAEKAGMKTDEFVQRNSDRFVDLVKALNITTDDFIRTTSQKHFDGAQKLWSACNPDDIYKKGYTGLYCVGCEQFYTEAELVDGKCPEHLTVPEEIQEENYFFKLSKYQKQLEDLIASDELKIYPESRKNEVLSFIRMGLEDFSISRSQARAKHWGVPVPGDDSQVMYVWYDALSNYITALDYATDGEKFKEYWPAQVHMLGKGVIRFHAVYWPAMLLSAGLPLPKSMFVHGYINVSGMKMSKSIGNVIDPFEMVEKYGTEVIRHYLLRYIHPVQDSDFSVEQLEDAHTSDLSNGLGNVVSRVSGLIEQNSIAVELKETYIYPELIPLVEEFKFDQAMKHIWARIGAVDLLISEKKPWELIKAGNIDEASMLLNQAANEIMLIAYNLQPFLPDTAKKIIEQYSQPQIKKGEPLFPRLA